MLRLLRLRCKNFLTFGDRWTEVDLSALGGLAAIRGVNMDVGEGQDSRNAVGKSALMDAISYAWFGVSVRRRRPGSLVNDRNGKGMEVQLEWEQGGLIHRVERGHKPVRLRLFRKPSGDPRPWTDRTTAYDEAGKRNVDAEIRRVLRMDHELAINIVFNSARVEPFFKRDASKQKHVVEELFGFGVLTLKGEDLKKERSKLEIQLEAERRVLQSIRDSNQRIEAQIAQKRRESAMWEQAREKQLREIGLRLADLRQVDFDGQAKLIDAIDGIAARLDSAERKYKERTEGALLRKLRSEVTSIESTLSTLSLSVSELEGLDSAGAVEGFDLIAEAEAAIRELDAEAKQHWAEIMRLDKERAAVQRKQMEHSEDCPTCGQKWPDIETRLRHRAEHERTERELTASMEELVAAHTELGQQIKILREAMPDRASLGFGTRDDALRAGERLASYRAQLDEARPRLDPARRELEAEMAEVLRLKEELDAAQDAFDAAPKPDFGPEELSALSSEIASLEASAERISSEKSPFDPAIAALESAIQPLDTSAADDMESRVNHSKYLEGLLLRSDSPVRRRITARWIPKLNSRMKRYLAQMELPYQVEFTEELEEPRIVKPGGTETDYDSLSGGEEDRLNLTVNWAFRDVWEHMNETLGLLAVDERLDGTLDDRGVANALEVLRGLATGGRSVLLISHRPDVANHADHVVTVTKDSGFSSVQVERAA
jgi:DNA repair exonuclease SbcCD ATPase subunit